MKNFINIWICAALFVFASCSEDINSDPELGGPLYGLSKGEPGSVEELVCIIFMIITNLLFKCLIGAGILTNGILLLKKRIRK